MYWISIHFTEINNNYTKRKTNREKKKNWEEKTKVDKKKRKSFGANSITTQPVHLVRAYIHIYIYTYLECIHEHEQSIRCEWLLRWITFTARGLTIQINIWVLCTQCELCEQSARFHTHAQRTHFVAAHISIFEKPLSTSTLFKKEKEKRIKRGK